MRCDGEQELVGEVEEHGWRDCIARCRKSGGVYRIWGVVLVVAGAGAGVSHVRGGRLYATISHRSQPDQRQSGPAYIRQRPYSPVLDYLTSALEISHASGAVG
jgi:hypothetical protein